MRFEPSMQPVKVVLDTNAFVSSFLGNGPPRSIVALWRDGRIVLCLSQPMVDEYVAVLRRLIGDCPELRELLELFKQGYNIIFTAETPELHIVRKDPADEKFLECAVALSCPVVISGDKDLLSVGRYIDIDILPPRKFLATYG